VLLTRRRPLCPNARANIDRWSKCSATNATTLRASRLHRPRPATLSPPLWQVGAIPSPRRAAQSGSPLAATVLGAVRTVEGRYHLRTAKGAESPANPLGHSLCCREMRKRSATFFSSWRSSCSSCTCCRNAARSRPDLTHHLRDVKCGRVRVPALFDLDAFSV
jgi:hypothetical protein